MENYLSSCNFSKLKILLGVILNNQKKKKKLSCVIIKKEIIVVNLFISMGGMTCHYTHTHTYIYIYIYMSLCSHCKVQKNIRETPRAKKGYVYQF